MNAENTTITKSPYIILKTFDSEELAWAVEMSIEDGYKPHGSLVIIQPIWHNGHIIKQAEYLQPMTLLHNYEQSSTHTMALASWSKLD